MREEREERTRKKKKKKNKIGYYLYAVIVLLLAIVIIVIATLLLTHVQKIEVTGTVYSEKQAIIDWVKEDPYTSNSIYGFWKFKTGMYQKPEYLETVDAGIAVPWVLNVKVKEKQIAGCMIVGSEYIYFDREGLVLLKRAEPLEGYPVVEGVEAGEPKLYKKLEVENEKVFSYIVELTEELKLQNLQPERIEWESDSMNLHFGGVTVRLGKNNFEEKLLQLPPILEKLEGKTGVLKMEYYNETSTSISFREEVSANE